jgi:hypothetical protein
MSVTATSEYEAKVEAAKMLSDDRLYAVIWHGLVEVATVRLRKPR